MVQMKLIGEFDRSLSKLKPLMDKIKRTDWLTDQVVYRLYGLSEAEVAVTEKAE